MSGGQWNVIYTLPPGGFVKAAAVIAVVCFAGGAVAWGTMSDPPPPPAPTTTAVNDPSPDGVGCHGASCTGQDPVAMGCDKDAQTLESMPDGSSRIRLRVSAACDAGWAQVFPGGNGHNDVTVEGSDTQTSPPSHRFHTGSSRQYTRMVSGDHWVRACAADGRCTAYH